MKALDCSVQTDDDLPTPNLQPWLISSEEIILSNYKRMHWNKQTLLTLFSTDVRC